MPYKIPTWSLECKRTTSLGKENILHIIKEGGAKSSRTTLAPQRVQRGSTLELIVHRLRHTRAAYQRC